MPTGSTTPCRRALLRRFGFHARRPHALDRRALRPEDPRRGGAARLAGVGISRPLRAWRTKASSATSRRPRHEEYCFLHRTLNRFDGLDIALLYRGDRFRPSGPARPRMALRGRGLRAGRSAPQGRGAGRARRTPCRRSARRPPGGAPALPLLVAGASHRSWPAVSGCTTPMRAGRACGPRNVRYRSGWRMRDRILVDTLFAPPRVGDVYARRRFSCRRTTERPCRPTTARTLPRGVSRPFRPPMRR